MKKNLLTLTFEKINSINKKMTLLVLAIVFGNLLIAQLPSGHFGIYEFNNGSLSNTSNTGTAANLVGTATATIDRFSNANDAITVSGSLNGVGLGTTNITNSTLSFWIKTPTFTTAKRIVQIYGNGGNGYRITYNGTYLTLNAKASTNSGFLGNTISPSYTLDDNVWHHIAVRTSAYASNTTIRLELFVDGVLNSNILDINPAGSIITSFLQNATFVIDPLNAYTGSIDDVYLYKGDLTDAQIIQIYNYTPTPPATRYYVDIDATGNNDGTSWTDAYTNLQDAFANANQGMEIWVADGTYKRQGTNRSSSFGWAVDSVTVYGGFNGTETLLSQRDWIANRTIMSGDIGAAGNSSDNCYTVFTGPAGSSSNILSYGLLDGFVIQDGNANYNGNGWGSVGAGYFNAEYNTKMEFHNCEFSNNNAKFSAAFYSYANNNDIELIVDACIFKNNTGRWAVGSHIASTNGASMDATITNCLYIDNETKDMGSLGLGSASVLYAQANNSSPNFNLKVVNTTFANNQNNGTFGTNPFSTLLYYTNSTSGTHNISVDNCIFWGNTGDTASILQNPGGGDFTSIAVKNTISEYTSFPSIATLTNVINQNPLFTSSTDFTLQGSSPALNAGSLSGLTIPMFDLAGNARLNGSAVDMGCYENQCPVGIIIPIYQSDDTLYTDTGNDSYQWSFEGNIINGATSYFYTPTVEGNYSVIVTINGCDYGETHLYCSYDNALLTEDNGILTADAGGTNYEWYLDGNYITGSNGTSNTFTTTSDGVYFCNISFSNGCGKSTNEVSICSSVTVAITESNGTFTATAGYTYEWFQDGVSISGATAETYTATENGNYYCNASDGNCTASSNMITYTKPTAINNLSFKTLKIFPNPTNGIVNISVNETLSSIVLFDLTGKTVKEFNSNSRQLDVSDINAGIYFLEIANAEKKSIIKIIKK